jgi:hypothetical protein
MHTYIHTYIHVHAYVRTHPLTEYWRWMVASSTCKICGLLRSSLPLLFSTIRLQDSAAFCILTRGKSVNRSQMDIKLISRHILHQHWYSCPVTLPVHRNPTSAPGRAPSAAFECSWENFSSQLWTALRYKHFPPRIGNISVWIFVALRPFAHKNNTTERWSS